MNCKKDDLILIEMYSYINSFGTSKVVSYAKCELASHVYIDPFQPSMTFNLRPVKKATGAFLFWLWVIGRKRFSFNI